MEKETVITLHSPVYCNAEYSEKPGAAVIELTVEDLEKIKHLTKIIIDEGLSTITMDRWCGWFDARPAYTFDELGSKFIVAFDDYDFDDMLEETDPDANFSYETLSGSDLVITKYGILFTANAKHSENVFETRTFSLTEIDDTLNGEGDTPREKYYFFEDSLVPALEDLPKMLNDADLRLSTYAKELLKKGV
jgi:hypothetical protein